MPYEGEVPSNPYSRLNPWGASRPTPYTWRISSLKTATPEPASPAPEIVVEPEPAVFAPLEDVDFDEEEAVAVAAVTEPAFAEPLLDTGAFFRPGLVPEPEPEPAPAAIARAQQPSRVAADRFSRPGLSPVPALKPEDTVLPDLPRRHAPLVQGSGAVTTDFPLLSPMDVIRAPRRPRPEPQAAAPEKVVEKGSAPLPKADFHTTSLSNPGLPRANRLVLTPVVEELPPPRYAPAPRTTFEREAEPPAKWAPLPLNSEAPPSTPSRIERRLGAGPVEPYPIDATPPMSAISPRDYGLAHEPKRRWPAIAAGLGVVSAGALGVGAAVALLKPHSAPTTAPVSERASHALAIESAPEAPPPESSLIAEPPVSSIAHGGAASEAPAMAFTPTLHRTLARASRHASEAKVTPASTTSSDSAPLVIATPPPIVLTPAPTVTTPKSATLQPATPDIIKTRRGSKG